MNEPPGRHDPDGVIIAALLAACPACAPAWRSHAASKSDDEGVYSDLGVFARELVTMLERGETAHFVEVFAAVELLLLHGDAGVRYATTWGLLEDLGNVAANKHGWPFAENFRRWFGPTTSAAWEEIHEVWGTADIK